MYYAIFQLLIIVCCYRSEFSGKRRIFDDYMSRDRTTSIKGIFAVIIVLSHLLQYVSLREAGDVYARSIISNIGQLMVTVFFFYSGYGIVESCKRNQDYMKCFFRNRFLKTLVHFDLAIILFAVVNLLMGKPNKLSTFLWALTGWKGIGNSNWFIFCTLVLYLLTIPVFILLRKHRPEAVGAMWILTLGFIVFLRTSGKDSWWYNTLLCYPLGMLWSEMHEYIEKKFSKNILYWWGTAAVIASVFAFCHIIYSRRRNGIPYPGFLRNIDPQIFYLFFACMFCLFVAVTQMRLRTHNPVLHWLGVHSFSIYILQRIPMRVLDHFGLAENTGLFIFISFAATLLIAPAFTYATNQLDRVLFPGKPNKKEKYIVHHRKPQKKSGKH